MPAGVKLHAGQLSGPLPYLSPHVSTVVQDTWDIHNPEKVTLPSYNATFCYDVKCITAVGNNEIWVGAGPSIFFLDEQTLERRVSYTLYCYFPHESTICQ